MKNLLVFFVLGVLLAGCINPPSGDDVVCNPPYIKVGGECCLDRDGNGVCDRDETTTTLRVTTTMAGATTTVAGAAGATTTLPPTTTTVKSNLQSRRVALTGLLVNDVDPVLTPNNNQLLQPTHDGINNFLDVVDMNALGLAGSVKLSGELVTGLDVLPVGVGKALMPTKSSLDVIDLAGKSIVKTLPLAGEPKIDVDVQVTPDGSTALMPSRQDASNSFIELINLGSNTITGKLFLQGDLKEGVDCVINPDGSRAFMPTVKPTVGSNVNFIDIAGGSVLKRLGVDGALEQDVDAKLKSNGEILLVPTRTTTRGFLTIIEAKAMSIQRRIELTGTLKESVDAYYLPDERYAYIPVTKGNQGFLDVIDVTGKQLKYSVRLSGDLVHGVDSKHVPDGSVVLALSQRGTTAYLDIIDPANGKVLKVIQLPGELQTNVDLQITEDGRRAYVPVRRPGRGKIVVVDLTSRSVVKTIDLSADYKADVDPLLTVNAGKLAAPSSKQAAYIDIITNVPANAVSTLTTGLGFGFVDVIDLSTHTVFGSMNLPGDIVVGVDGISDGMASTTPGSDEDLLLGDAGGEDDTVTTTTYVTTTTSYTTTTTYIYYTTTTIRDYVSTSTTQPDDTGSTTTTTTSSTTSTTVQDMVITPRCGDGYLSTAATPGGGSEECDLADNPNYNNWDGATVYNCPGGLQCVNCKCVGCGDGRLQDGEECDKWLVKVKDSDGSWLWEGDLIDCSGQYEACNMQTCQCESTVTCGEGLYDSDNCDGQCGTGRCVQFEDTPCYHCVCPDLYVNQRSTSIHKSTSTSCVNDVCTTTCTLEATVDIKIGNGGTDSAPASSALIEVAPNVGTSTKAIEALAPGAVSSMKTANFNKQATVSGSGEAACSTLNWWVTSYTTTVTADSEGAVGECDENNNIGSGTVSPQS